MEEIFNVLKKKEIQFRTKGHFHNCKLKTYCWSLPEHTQLIVHQVEFLVQNQFLFS